MKTTSVMILPNAVATECWVARASRVLENASRVRGLSLVRERGQTPKARCGETPQPTRETRALPRQTLRRA
jgi:hypothetical protein